MDPTASLATTLLASPVAAAAGMVVGIFLLNLLKGWLPAFVTGAAKPAAAEPETPRPWQLSVVDGAEAIERLVAELRDRNNLARREIEILGNVERSLLELLAERRLSAGRAASPAPRRPAAMP